MFPCLCVLIKVRCLGREDSARPTRAPEYDPICLGRSVARRPPGSKVRVVEFPAPDVNGCPDACAEFLSYKEFTTMEKGTSPPFI